MRLGPGAEQHSAVLVLLQICTQPCALCLTGFVTAEDAVLLLHGQVSNLYEQYSILRKAEERKGKQSVFEALHNNAVTWMMLESFREG